MKTIDLTRIREALPKHAKVKLGKTKNQPSCPYIECIVRFPSLCEGGTTEQEKDWQMVLDWQEQIIGKENIAEFYVEETGNHWFIYLKRQPMEFINAEDGDVNSFINFELIKDGKL